jgi:hypothetical protein
MHRYAKKFCKKNNGLGRFVFPGADSITKKLGRSCLGGTELRLMRQGTGPLRGAGALPLRNIAPMG